MADSHASLRTQCTEIWTAGLAAVDSKQLVARNVHPVAGGLSICDQPFKLSQAVRILVVGAGKAGAGMAAGFESAIGPELLEQTSGLINVPADCVDWPTVRIELHAARPAGLNEPTQAGVEGTRRILNMVSNLNPDDLCVVLISGGGSALLPAPVEQISLADKQAVTRLLMHRGATINELNCVRKQLSAVKGGRLAAACTASQIVTLIVSDVIHDPLDVIASGPTVEDPSTPAEALAILDRVASASRNIPSSVRSYLSSENARPVQIDAEVSNFVIGNNAVALDAARQHARSLGFNVHSLGSNNAGIARDVGRELFRLACKIRAGSGPVPMPACILSGGEPTVELAETNRSRKGGRNQELVLAAMETGWDDFASIVFLSGGTDGEDGPTDAAGAVSDFELIQRAKSDEISPQEYLAINNSYPFFEQIGGLLQTGPTHTNVRDLRIVLIK